MEAEQQQKLLRGASPAARQDAAGVQNDANQSSDVELDEVASNAMKLHRLDCVYRLHGIVIHRGSHNSGHYYSYVRERPQDALAVEAGFPRGTSIAADSRQSSDVGRWIQFDDHRVREVPFEEVRNDALGGSDLVRGRNVERLNSAFILFYDRMPRAEAQQWLQK